MAVEAVLAIGAGIAARSVLLTAFGFDSVIELISGGTLLWRRSSEAPRASSERKETVRGRGAKILALLPGVLCRYLVVVGVAGLVGPPPPLGRSPCRPGGAR